MNTQPVSDSLLNDFYVLARESGATESNLPIWTSHSQNPFQLNPQPSKSVERVEVENVPGAFQLLNVLSASECQDIINLTERLGYTVDAPVSLPHHIRHNNNLNWAVDTATVDIIWSRCQALFTEIHNEHFFGKQALGLNARFRIYRYEQQDYFQLHTDGSWPGTRVIDGRLVQNAYDDRWSMYTFLMLLSDDFTGGATQFLVNKNNPQQPPPRRLDEANIVNVRTPAGGVLCFPHGTHPYHCLHASAPIQSGIKYIIRSDVLFEI